MAYKTILVHLNDKRRAARLLAPAVALAAKWNAHLIGLHVFPAVPRLYPLGLNIGGDVVGEIATTLRTDAEQIRAVFDRVTANQPFVAEWACFKAVNSDLAEVVMSHGRAADLIVASQSDPDWELSPVFDFPERLAVEGGRPVLVVPNSGHFDSIGRNITVAWNGSRESARAVFDAMPLLTAADEVRVLGVAEDKLAADGGSRLPDTSIAATLARHGVKTTALAADPGNKDVPAEILRRVADAEGDLLVMGAYGHSRLSEFVFGGATRHIARHMAVPTLFSH